MVDGNSTYRSVFSMVDTTLKLIINGVLVIRKHGYISAKILKFFVTNRRYKEAKKKKKKDLI